MINLQARSDDSERGNSRIAHVPVNITVLDENDNSPMFVNLPYYAVVSVDAEKGAVITRVSEEPTFLYIFYDGISKKSRVLKL